MAGTGKSTIARTIARRYYNQGRLAASFFFSRGGGDVGNATKFVATIVKQLAIHIPRAKPYIEDALTKSSIIASQSLIDQWDQLVLGPLSQLNGGDTYIMVIDALDEGDSENNVQIILRLLAEVRSLEKVRLRVLITSRLEVSVLAEHRIFILHDIEPKIVDGDIFTFLYHELDDIGREQNLGANWPGDKVVEVLVKKANGLFIWAATASSFIRSGRLFVRKRLDTILNDNRLMTAPEEHLNKMYLAVLRDCIGPVYTEQERIHLYEILRTVLGSIVTLASPLSLTSLSALLNMGEEDVARTLRYLYAILDISEDRTRLLRLHHPSFRDFLLDKDRCGDPNFTVDEEKAHTLLARHCIQLMSTSLKQDICGLDDPAIYFTTVENNRVEKTLPPHVQYACLYWVQHLEKGGDTLYDDDEFHQFIQTHLLHWFEALSWMRKISEGILAVVSLESIALVSILRSITRQHLTYR
jgi:hypothetical protein